MTVLESINFGKYENTVPYSRANVKAYDKEESRLITLFQADLIKEFGLENHPKVALCFSKAWDRGSGEGMEAIYYWFSDYAELLK